MSFESNKIEGLFNEIAQYEIRAQKHREELDEAKSKVTQKKTELTEMQQDNRRLGGRLVVKTETLGETETKMTCITIKEKALSDVMESLMDAGKQISSHISDMESNRNLKRQKFKKLVGEFTAQFGIFSDWASNERERRSQETISSLKKQIIDCQHEIQGKREILVNQEGVSARLEQKRKEKEEHSKKLKEVDRHLEEETSSLQQLDKVIAELEAAPQKSDEFKRLRFEISRLQRAEVDAKSEQLRWTHHQKERERQNSYNYQGFGGNLGGLN